MEPPSKYIYMTKMFLFFNPFVHMQDIFARCMGMYQNLTFKDIKCKILYSVDFEYTSFRGIWNS